MEFLRKYFTKVKKLAQSESFQVIFVVVTSSLIFIYNLDKESLWLDEIYTYYASNTWEALTATIPWKEKNMWLFHIVMYFWKFLGPGEFVMRLLAAVFAVGGVVAMYKLGKEISNKKLGFIAALLLSLNTFYIHYAQEARAYSLYSFLFILSSLFLIKFSKKSTNGNQRWYVLFTSLSFFSHIFAFLIVPFQVLFLLWRFIKSKTKISKIITTYLFIGLSSLLILVPYILNSSSTSGGVATRTKEVLTWIQVPTVESLFQLYYSFASNSVSLFLTYIALLCWLIAGLVILRRDKIVKHTSIISYFAAIGFGTVFVIYVFSHMYAPFFIDRYFITVVPSIIILTSISILSFKNKFISIFFFVALLLFSVKALNPYYSNYKKEQWRQSLEFINSKQKPGEAVVIFPNYLSLPVKYYGDYDEKYLVDNTIVAYPNDLKDFSDTNVSQNINTLFMKIGDSKGVWVLSRIDVQPAPRELQKEAMLKALSKKYKNQNKIDTFTALDVIYYSN